MRLNLNIARTPQFAVRILLFKTRACSNRAWPVVAKTMQFSVSYRMVSHYLLCACSEEHVIPNCYNYFNCFLMQARPALMVCGQLVSTAIIFVDERYNALYITRRTVVFLSKLLQCQLQSCSINFIKAGFQLTVEKQLATTKSRISW